MATLTQPQSNALPKYLDLCQLVEEQIESGELKPGDRLPSFVQMREQFGATTATVERVLRTLEKKGLVRREPSRGTFVTARSHAQVKGIVGILTQTAYRQHPYYSLLLNGAQEEAHNLGIEVLLLLENSVVSRDKVDGLLVMGAHENLLRQVPLEMPRVSLMGVLPGMSGIIVDDGQGTAAAVEHLIELGHRRIAFLTVGNSPYADVASIRRFESYQQTLRKHGIKPNRRWVKSLRDEDNYFRGFAVYGREKMQQWLEEDWDELGCTALLTQNDEVAFQVMQVLQAADYNIPRDVSVVGFDDTAVCTWILPHLTTVNVGLENVGARAVQLLLEKVAEFPTSNNGHGPSVVTLSTELVIRESTGPAPA